MLPAVPLAYSLYCNTPILLPFLTSPLYEEDGQYGYHLPFPYICFLSLPAQSVQVHSNSYYAKAVFWQILPGHVKLLSAYIIILEHILSPSSIPIVWVKPHRVYGAFLPKENCGSACCPRPSWQKNGCVHHRHACPIM